MNDEAKIDGALIVLQRLAIQGVYLVTFALAAWLKWSKGLPAWFASQFGDTWLASIPGGLKATYYSLAGLESIAAIGFAVSLVRWEARRPGPWLSRALTFSLFVFVALTYGSRLTQKFDVAAINFAYFVGTLICLRLYGDPSPTRPR